MRQIAPVLVAALVLAAGCGGGAGGRTPAPITATASKATVAAGALDATGYREARIASEPFNASGQVAVAGDVQMELQYRFEATAWRAVYLKDGSPPSVFAVYAVPQVRPEDVAVTLDPLRDRSPAEIAALAQDRYTGLADLRATGNRTVTMLGNGTTLRTYAATAGGTPVSVHVARTVHRGDVVVAVGIHPRDADGTGAVVSLVGAVEH